MEQHCEGLNILERRKRRKIEEWTEKKERGHETAWMENGKEPGRRAGRLRGKRSEEDEREAIEWDESFEGRQKW